MKWLKICLAIMVIISSLLPAIVLAGTQAEVTLYATPLVSTGITGFTITYISETCLQFDWGFSDNCTRIVIRGKYGTYPDNISNNSTEPSDGYLVYDGSGVTANDTTMDFDENPGKIYYRAWAWSAEKGWHTTPSNGSEESRIVTLLAFFLLACIVSYIAVRSTYYPIKFFAGLAWWVVAFVWMNGGRPSLVTTGTSADTAVIVFLFGIGVAMMIMPFYFSNKNGNSIPTGFKVNMDRLIGREEPPSPPTNNWQTRADAHREKLRAALRGERTRR